MDPKGSFRDSTPKHCGLPSLLIVGLEQRGHHSPQQDVPGTSGSRVNQALRTLCIRSCMTRSARVASSIAFQTPWLLHGLGLCMLPLLRTLSILSMQHLLLSYPLHLERGMIDHPFGLLSGACMFVQPLSAAPPRTLPLTLSGQSGHSPPSSEYERP